MQTEFVELESVPSDEDPRSASGSRFCRLLQFRHLNNIISLQHTFQQLVCRTANTALVHIRIIRWMGHQTSKCKGTKDTCSTYAQSIVLADCGNTSWPCKPRSFHPPSRRITGACCPERMFAQPRIQAYNLQFQSQDEHR